MSFIGPKFPKDDKRKSLEQLAMEASKDLYKPVMYVNAFSRVPYRVQIWVIRIKLFVQRTLS